MAQVTNTTYGPVDVPLYGLRFKGGETLEVPDDIARELGGPLAVEWPAPEPSAEAVTAPAAVPTAPSTGGNAS